MLGGGADTDVYLTFSDDNGATWSTPTLITPMAGDDKIQFWPVVTVGPQGEVNVVYYESQETTTTSNPFCTIRVATLSGNVPLRRRGTANSLVNTFWVSVIAEILIWSLFAASVNLLFGYVGLLSFGQALFFGFGMYGVGIGIDQWHLSFWCRGTVNIRPNFGDYIGATTVGPKTYAVWADDRNTIMIGGVPRNVVDVFYTSARTIAGDVNGDLKVNILDVAAAAYAFSTKPGAPRWNEAADMNNDGSIDILDVAIVAFYFGTSG